MIRIILLSTLLLVAPACSKQPKTPQNAINQTKFEAVYRSAKSIQGAMAVGVSYQKFGELLQGLATEISIAGDKATSEREKELVGLYAEALKVYNDSNTLWKNKIKHSDDMWEGQVIYSVARWNVPEKKITGSATNSELTPIIEKYHLSLSDNSKSIRPGVRPYLTWKFISSEAIQTVWEAASPILEKANKLYYSQQTPH